MSAVLQDKSQAPADKRDSGRLVTAAELSSNIETHGATLDRYTRVYMDQQKGLPVISGALFFDAIRFSCILQLPVIVTLT